MSSGRSAASIASQNLADVVMDLSFRASVESDGPAPVDRRVADSDLHSEVVDVDGELPVFVEYISMLRWRHLPILQSPDPVGASGG